MKQQINSYRVGGGSNAVASDIRTGDWSVGGWVEQMDMHVCVCVFLCVCLPVLYIKEALTSNWEEVSRIFISS